MPWAVLASAPACLHSQDRAGCGPPCLPAGWSGSQQKVLLDEPSVVQTACMGPMAHVGPVLTFQSRSMLLRGAEQTWWVSKATI